MDDAQIIFYDALPPAQQEALRAALRDNPALAEAFGRWRRVRRRVRERLEADLPERRLLVLYALEAQEPALLSEEERRALEAARASLEKSLRAHPALADVVRYVQHEERNDFEAAWKEHAGAEPARQRTPPGDRPARAGAAAKAAPHPLRRWAWRLGAGAALLLFAAALFFLMQRDRHLVTVTAGQGQVRHVELGAGSTVRLLPGAQLTYVEPKAGVTFDRRARLVGRAFFRIAPGQKGFVLETPTAQATVLGTHFGVEADAAVTEVVLAAGRLALAPKDVQDQFVILEPGQMSRVAQNARPATPVSVDLAEALTWTGLFVFRDTPVEAIARRLSRHYGVAVEVASALEGQQVTGTFEQERPVAEVLRVLAAALGAEVRTPAEDAYRLVPAGSE